MSETCNSDSKKGVEYADSTLTKQEQAMDALPDETILYEAAELFKVFGDTTRLKILCVLIEGELNVNAIADKVQMSQSAVSHQLRVLKQARLAKFRRAGKQIVYSLADSHVRTMLAEAIDHVCE